MTTLQGQDDEAKEMSRKYDLLCLYCDVGLARVQFIQEYFRKVSAIMRQTEMGLTVGMGKDRKSDVSLQNVRGFVDFVLNVGKAADTFKEQFVQAADVIDEIMLPILEKLANDVSEKIGNSRTSVENAEKRRSQCSDKLGKLMKTVERQADEAKKAYAHLKKLQDLNTGQDKKYCETVAMKCKEYCAQTRLCEQVTCDLNAAHHEFGRIVSREMAELCTIETERVNRLMILFEMFLPSFGKAKDVFMKGKSYFDQLKLEWEPDFLAFVKSERIFRGNLPAEMYNPYQFPTDDPDLKPPPPDPTIECVDAPVLVAKALESYSATGTYELSVNAGEMLYLYEQPKQEFCYAANESGDKMGYVPSRILQLDKRELALVRKCFISSEQGGIMVAIGDVVVVESRTEKGVMCRNREGERGLIPIDNLVFRTEMKL